MPGDERRLGRRVRDAAVALAFVVLTATSLALVVGGEGAERMLGVACLLLFGVGGLASFALHLSSRRPRGPRVELVRWRGGHESALVFPQARGQGAIAVVGAAAITAAGVLLAGFAGEISAEPGRRMLGLVAGVLCAAVFCAMLVLGVLALAREPAHVALLREGILVRGIATSSFVPWDAVEAVDIVDIHDTPLVGLVADPAAIEVSGRAGALMAAGRRVTGFELVYGGLGVPAEALAREIRRCVEDPAARARIGTEDRGYTEPAVPR